MKKISTSKLFIILSAAFLIGLIFFSDFITSRIQDFFTLLLSLLIEATPFVLLGVLVSAFVGVFIKEEWIFRIIPKNTILGNLVISFTGFLMPVCECGNIPVARRLLLKGFKPSQAITFLMAAPIVNFVTFFSTREAFRILSDSVGWEIAFIRIVSALIVANIIGFVFSFSKKDEELLESKFYGEVCDAHDHHDSVYEIFNNSKLAQKEKYSRFLKEAGAKSLHIFQDEFLPVMRMLFIGASIAALTRTFIPTDWIINLGQDPFTSILAMIILSFVISICANVDAFFAASLSNIFSLGSLMSFMVFGPMIDIKILSMLRTTFKPKVLIMVSVLVFVLSLIVGLAVNYFF
jgi:hypothetical protein